MKKQVLVIHGGSAYEMYDEYLADLIVREVTFERLNFKGWKLRLGELLGDGYQVLNPQMPNSQNARYAEWKIWFEKLILLLEDDAVLVGHSLGGIFLAKYLSENEYPKKIKATFLVASPYNTENEHPLVDFIISKDLSLLEKQGGEIHIYHSKDDQIVPYTNFLSYKESLPNAQVHIFEDQGHFHQESFPELIEDIKELR